MRIFLQVIYYWPPLFPQDGGRTKLMLEGFNPLEALSLLKKTGLLAQPRP